MKHKLQALLKHKILLAVIVIALVVIIAYSCSDNGTTGEAAVKLYKSVITEYTELLNLKLSGEELPALTGEESDITRGLHKAVSAVSDPSVMGYATRDINGDGIDELVLLSKVGDLYGLFTLVEKKPLLLQAMDGKNAAIDENGFLYYNEFVPDQSYFVLQKEIVDGTLTGFEFGYTVTEDGKWLYYQDSCGTRVDISNQDYLQLNDNYMNTFKRDTFITKKAGFRFVPLFESDKEAEKAPVLRLRTYDDVLAMYKAVTELYAEFSEGVWSQGVYDSLYTFHDNESFAAFHAVLYAGYLNGPASGSFGASYPENANDFYGYAYRDVDGDGTDELFLLTEDYSILAIFTRENGKAVLLTAATDSLSVWLDADGLFHVKKTVRMPEELITSYELSALKGDKLSAKVAITEKAPFLNVDSSHLPDSAYYKTEDGQRVAITGEEFRSLYELWNPQPDEATAPEIRTEREGGLTFTPLFG